MHDLTDVQLEEAWRLISRRWLAAHRRFCEIGTPNPLTAECSAIRNEMLSRGLLKA